VRDPDWLALPDSLVVKDAVVVSEGDPDCDAVSDLLALLV